MANHQAVSWDAGTAGLSELRNVSHAGDWHCRHPIVGLPGGDECATEWVLLVLTMAGDMLLKGFLAARAFAACVTNKAAHTRAVRRSGMGAPSLSKPAWQAG